MLPTLYLILIRRSGSPYPEVTVVSLPSSLMIVSSNAFVFSTCLLGVVSRYGYYVIYQDRSSVEFIANLNKLVTVFPEPLSLEKGRYYVDKICSSFCIIL